MTTKRKFPLPLAVVTGKSLMREFQLSPRRKGVMTTEKELCPEVQWFAEQMELRLRANDHVTADEPLHRGCYQAQEGITLPKALER